MLSLDEKPSVGRMSHPSTSFDEGLKCVDASFLNTGFHTPSSSTYESRRDSILSLRSPTSYDYKFDHMASCGSAHRSPQLPATPSSTRDPIPDEFMVSTTAPNQQYASETAMGGDCYIKYSPETPVTDRSTEFPRTGHTSFHSDSSWIPTQHEDPYLHVRAPPAQKLSGYRLSVPDLGTPMHCGLPQTPQSTLVSPIDMVPVSRNWEALRSSMHHQPFLFPNGLSYTFSDDVNDLQPKMPCSWAPEMPMMSQYDTMAPNNSTLLPYDSIISGSETSSGESSQFPTYSDQDVPNPFEFNSGQFSPSSPVDRKISRSVLSSQDMKPEPSSSPSCEDVFRSNARVTRQIIRTSTGGKGIKKAKHRGTKKKGKSAKKTSSREFVASHGDQEIAFEIEGDFYHDGHEWKNMAAQKDTPRQCDRLLDDGEVCGKPFKRSEHLQRHITTTHDKPQPTVCALPIPIENKKEFGRLEPCKREFNRRDNLKAHYKTHIYQDKSGFYFPEQCGVEIQEREAKSGGRNGRLWWENFCAVIRRVKAHDKPEEILDYCRKHCEADDAKKLKQLRESKWDARVLRTPVRSRL